MTLKSVLSQYDETGLFFKLTPDKKLEFKSEMRKRGILNLAKRDF